MTRHLNEHDAAVWRRLVDSHKAFSLASREFLSPRTDRVALVRQALRTDDRATAVFMAPHLPISEIQQLLDVWVALASHLNGFTQTARDLILRLPRDWVLERIEAVAEPLLETGTDEEYRRLLELYRLLDSELTLRLARRAAASPDRHVREVGEEFLQSMSAG